VRTALRDPDVDSLVVVFVPPLATPGTAYARAIRSVVADLDEHKPIVSTFLATEGIPDELAVAGPGGSPGRGSIPSYPSPERAVLALARATRYAQWRQRPLGELVRPEGLDVEAARRIVADADGELSEEDTKRLLGCYGIGVEPEATEGTSCVIGVQDDPSFGTLVSFGLSDVVSELLDDRAYRALPLTDADAAALVRAPRAAPLLTGYRGSEPTDLDALADLVIRIAALAEDVPRVRWLALDPVRALADGVRVVRARVRVGPPPSRLDSGPRRLRSPGPDLRK
jgi:acyl-CoA synthetase (NDP forming)